MNDYEAILTTRVVGRDLAIADATTELLTVIPDDHIWRVDVYGDVESAEGTESNPTTLGIGLTFETATDLGLDSNPDERLEDGEALESIESIPVTYGSEPVAHSKAGGY
ncbi:hypothetical protein [Haloarchaeobius baliensis]|uniref:hypothetical protein n=1 Tax=Haloarchaeobius baliensis TaxID=1670458 RepID=UPI003F885742